MFVARGSSVRPPGRLHGRRPGRPDARTACLTAPDDPPNGFGWRSRRLLAPAVQPNQTKNNYTPTIARIVTDKNYCLFFLTKIERNMRWRKVIRV